MSVDYAQYLKLKDKWTGLEAICLLAGIDPQKYAKRLKNIHTKPTAKNLDLWNRVIDPINQAFMQSEVDGEITARIVGEAGRYYDPVKVVNWAISKGFDVHDKLRAFADSKKQQEETVSNEGGIKPRKGGYGDRDEVAIKIVEGRPEILEWRKKDIKKELQKHSIFISGFESWWRKNPIFPKGKPGK